MLDLEKPFYKKWWFIGIIVFLVLGAIGSAFGGKEDNAGNGDINNSEDVETIVDTLGGTPEEIITKSMNEIIDSEFTNVKVNKLEINNYQLEDDSFIVLAHLNWSTQNKADTTKQMLEMYSDKLATELYDNETEIMEVVVFWEVPHHLEGENIAKFNYTHTDKGMAKTDKWLAPILQ